MISVAHMCVSLLVWNPLSASYHLASVITSDQVSLWVVLDIVSLAFLIPIYHRFLNSFGNMVERRPLD